MRTKAFLSLGLMILSDPMTWMTEEEIESGRVAKNDESVNKVEVGGSGR